LPLQELLGSIARKLAPNRVRALVVGNDFPQELFRLVLETIDNHLGNVGAPILVATTSLRPLSDVPMSCAPLESVLEALQAVQEPAEPDLSEGILLPHRVERETKLLKVTPEFIKRIEKDLLVVHRALADWFPPDRAFGVDFRRGHLIEWSELDNNLDVQRQIFPALLKKVRTELSKSTNSTVNLLHEPSAGGTTLTRRLAWSLMEEYPVTLPLQMSSNTSDYLRELSQECGLPVLVVMEAEVITESEREVLFHQNARQQHPRSVPLGVPHIWGHHEPRCFGLATQR